MCASSGVGPAPTAISSLSISVASLPFVLPVIHDARQESDTHP
jgi:hypothetical protein